MGQEQRCRALALLGGLGALLLTAPTPPAALTTLARAASSPDPAAPLVAAVALLAWAVTGWLALTAVVVLLTRLPGLLGRTAGSLLRRLAPATVRRALEAALGLTVAVGALAPTAALAAPTAGQATVRVGTDAAWDLDWPSPAAAVTPPDSPVPDLPAPGAAPAALPPQPPTPPAVTPAVAPAVGPVVVRAGDSLWSLAEASLRRAGTAAPTDRQVAQLWPRWWAANRAVVGDDPDLLLPGTVLLPPPQRPDLP